MAFVLTYDNLQERVINYTTRVGDASFATNLPMLIAFAEKRCAREIKALGYKKFVTSNFQVGVPIYDKPARWRETVTINFGTQDDDNTRTTLSPRAYDFCRSYWPDDSQTGQPLYYADTIYDAFLIAPTPDLAYPFELVYYEQVEPLSDENQTNWLTEQAPDLVMYATLMEACGYLKTNDNLQKWTGAYETAKMSLLSEDERRIIDATIKRREGSK